MRTTSFLRAAGLVAALSAGLLATSASAQIYSWDFEVGGSDSPGSWTHINVDSTSYSQVGGAAYTLPYSSGSGTGAAIWPLEVGGATTDFFVSPTLSSGVNYGAALYFSLGTTFNDGVTGTDSYKTGTVVLTGGSGVNYSQWVGSFSAPTTNGWVTPSFNFTEADFSHYSGTYTDFSTFLANISNIWIQAEFATSTSSDAGISQSSTLGMVAIPEPSTYAMCLGGATLAVAAFVRRRKKL